MTSVARIDEQIRRARRECGLSREALAERIGVAPAELQRYEEGDEIPTRRLELIAVATGKPVSFFLAAVGDPTQNGRGVGGRLRAALAWLSEPSGVRPSEDELLAEVAARERALLARERRLDERERALLALERRLAAKAAPESPAEDPPEGPG